jgi:transcriptional regulator with GAF, ATPase, and Fis domain
LIESELFGHVKAFTSAVKDRAGKFEAADKGTIFLDEIGDMSLSAQTIACFTGKYDYQSGSRQRHQSRCSCGCSYNKDLKVEIAEGRFRKIYHRLAVILIKFRL